MTEWRFHPDGYYASAEFHHDREAADHLHEDGHRLRLWLAKGLIEATEASTWLDLGCGNGGLLEITSMPAKRGFDFQPANVADAQANGRPVTYVDFVAEPELPYAEVVSLTEVLEHLDDPHGLLKRVRCRWLVASVPNGETPENHWFGHTWGWDGHGFVELLDTAGFELMVYVQSPGTQTALAAKR